LENASGLIVRSRGIRVEVECACKFGSLPGCARRPCICKRAHEHASVLKRDVHGRKNALNKDRWWEEPGYDLAMIPVICTESASSMYLAEQPDPPAD
jgi:hypothetical protein